MMTLYDYCRSTASYRVRIVLQLKGIPYTKKEVHLVNGGGEQHMSAYHAINPQQRVPSLDDNGFVVTQSLAIIDYLEKKYPEPCLYTRDLHMDAKVNSIAQIVACDIHPLNNLSVLQYLKGEQYCDDYQKTAWYHHWVHQGFSAIEAMLDQGSDYCVGNQLTLADVCLVPQVYNANRFGVDMSAYPRISAINDYCLSLEVFSLVSPNVCFVKI